MTPVSRVRYWLPLLPIFGLLGITYWLNQQSQPLTAGPAQDKRHDPDAIMDNFSATRLDDQGVPSFIMSARKLLHYPDDDSTTIEDPHITMLSPGQPALHASAQTGSISRDGEAISLRDQVKVLREAGPKLGRFTLQTEYLHIVPDRNLTETNLPVTLIDAHNIVHATGMEMNNKTRILKLLSRVTSEHVPNRQ